MTFEIFSPLLSAKLNYYEESHGKKWAIKKTQAPVGLL